MGLDWDIKVDSVSIKDTISRFNIRESKGAYAREITITSNDPTFYALFDFSVLPSARLEVLTKVETSWISQGVFFIEKPTIVTNPDSSVSPGVWGRLESAVAGPPFAKKVTKSWDTDTTFSGILAEMAVLTGLVITSEITDYPILANYFVVEDLYPIDVISKLAEFSDGYISCTVAGALVIKKDIFHPVTPLFTFIDSDIADISEKVDYPDFGNRIKISALGELGYSINVVGLDDADCLASDGISTGTLLAFVYFEDVPVQDGTLVNWTAESGITLGSTTSATGEYLVSNAEHKASNYYKVQVDFAVKEVIGIWALSDTSHTTNLWNSSKSGCVFSGNEIFVHDPFAFCDKSLVVTYIVGGCAVNTVTAGNTAIDVTVTAEVYGDTGEIEVQLGNTCACGSKLGVKVVPSGDICFENTASILIWGVVNNKPAVGMNALVSITGGCGILSSTTKLLGSVLIEKEVCYALNTITGVTQVNVGITPDDLVTAPIVNDPVQMAANAAQLIPSPLNVDYYASHVGKLINLDTQFDTGTKLLITYTANGAAATSWLTTGITEECTATGKVTLANGTEAGLEEVFELTTVDCPDDTDTTIPITNDYTSSDDPDSIDNSSTPGGFVSDQEDGDSTIILTACDIAILNRIANIDNALPEDKDTVRFGGDCPPEGEPDACSCADMCSSEISEHGNTYDYPKTIAETAAESYTAGTPEYNQEYADILAANTAECEQKCATLREEDCGDCELVSGTASMTPGETAEFVCSDGTTGMYTMPVGTCGTVSVTMGCCTFEVRSTVGQWVQTVNNVFAYPASPICSASTPSCYEGEAPPSPNEVGTKCASSGQCYRSLDSSPGCNWIIPAGGGCEPVCDEYPGYTTKAINLSYYCWEWQCIP